MTDVSTPFAEPIDGREEIFRATYRALLAHGYAGLSIQRIADEASLSKSTIYHHFDSKDDLLLAFSEELLLQYLEEFFVEDGDDPIETLERVLDLFFLGRSDEGESLSAYAPAAIDRVYLELRAQASHDPDYRDRFEEIDALVRERAATVIQDAIDAGQMAPVDPDAVAGFLYVVVEGAMYLRSTTGDDEWLAQLRGEADRYLDQLVLTE